MFTQKISMDCTKEQYEKYLKDELLKMGYKEYSLGFWEKGTNQYITNSFGGENGFIGNINECGIKDLDRTYLGSFNAPLFLALAAMTDTAFGGYGEYWVNIGASGHFIKGNFYKSVGSWPDGTPMFINDVGYRDGYAPQHFLKNFRKATKDELYTQFNPLQISEGTYYVYDNRWVFIAKKGDNPTVHFCALNMELSIFSLNGSISSDAEITKIRPATGDEMKRLDDALESRLGRFDADKLEIRPLFEIGSYLTILSKTTTRATIIISGKIERNSTTDIPIAAGVDSSGRLYLNDKLYIPKSCKVRLSTPKEMAELDFKLAQKGLQFDEGSMSLKKRTELLFGTPDLSVLDFKIDTKKFERDMNELLSTLDSINEEVSIKRLKSKGYKILKPKTWEEV